MIQVKICGLKSIADAERCIDLGADYVGFVFEPTSPRSNSQPFDGLPLARLGKPAVAVYGPYLGGCPEGFEICQAISFAEEPTTPARWQVIRLQSVVPSVEIDLESYSKIVIDSYSPSSYGGTGSKIDKAQAKNFVAECPLPVVLAGGLNAENVFDACVDIRPAVVDVSSGVEVAPGEKDFGRVKAFIDEVRRANAELSQILSE